MRSLRAPFEKFGGTMTLGSHGVGWAQDDASLTSHVKYQGPEFGISDSVVTKVYNNMKATNMEAILRYDG